MTTLPSHSLHVRALRHLFVKLPQDAAEIFRVTDVVLPELPQPFRKSGGLDPLDCRVVSFT